MRSLEWSIHPYAWCPYKKWKFGHRCTYGENTMWTWRERLGRCCRSQGMPEMARQSPEGGRQGWNWVPITALEKNHSADTLIWGFQVPTTLWLKAIHLWCSGRQPQEVNPGGNIIFCNDVLLFIVAPTPSSAQPSPLPHPLPHPPTPPPPADSRSFSFFDFMLRAEIRQSVLICKQTPQMRVWFIVSVFV